MKNILKLLQCIASSVITTVPLTAAPSTGSKVLCSGIGGETTLSFQASVILDRKLLGKTEEPHTALLKAAKQQLLYFSGYLNNSAHADELKFAIAGDGIRIEPISFSDVPYVYKLAIDKLSHPRYPVTDPYQLRAIEAGKVSHADPGIKMTYRAILRAALCKPGTFDAPGPISFALPWDPYLAYWTVPKDARRKILWRKSQWEINPCADSELADIPDPIYYWYFWDPHRRGRDADGRAFDCNTLMQGRRDYQELSVSAGKLSLPDKKPWIDRSLLPHDRPLRAMIIVGIINADATIFPGRKLRDSLREGSEGFAAKVTRFLDEGGLTLERWKGDEPDSDQGSRYWIGLLRGLSEVVTISHYESRFRSHTLTLQLSGVLMRSRRRIELTLSFGPTDLLGPQLAEHWPLLLEGLSRSDLLIYVGHSGLGENGSLVNLAKGLRMPLANVKSRVRRPPFQMLVYSSCASYSYFGLDVLAARAGKKERTALALLSGTVPPARTALGFLDYWDRLLTPHTDTNLIVSSPPYFSLDDGWVLLLP